MKALFKHTAAFLLAAAFCAAPVFAQGEAPVLVVTDAGSSITPCPSVVTVAVYADGRIVRQTRTPRSPFDCNDPVVKAAELGRFAPAAVGALQPEIDALEGTLDNVATWPFCNAGGTTTYQARKSTGELFTFYKNELCQPYELSSKKGFVLRDLLNGLTHLGQAADQSSL